MRYVLLGIYFGIVLTKGQLVSWFRLQEMFRFQSFYMYGVIGSAVGVAAIALAFMGRPLERKRLGRGVRFAIGGTIFGLGWGLAGVCPGPMFALLGGGHTVVLIVFAAALLGTWLYGALESRLPH